MAVWLQEGAHCTGLLLALRGQKDGFKVAMKVRMKVLCCPRDGRALPACFRTSPTVDALLDKSSNARTARNFGSLAGWKFLQFCGIPCLGRRGGKAASEDP